MGPIFRTRHMNSIDAYCFLTLPSMGFIYLQLLCFIIITVIIYFGFMYIQCCVPLCFMLYAMTLGDFLWLSSSTGNIKEITLYMYDNFI